MKDLAIFSYKYTKHEKLLQDILSDKHLIYTTVLFFFTKIKRFVLYTFLWLATVRLIRKGTNT